MSTFLVRFLDVGLCRVPYTWEERIKRPVTDEKIAMAVRCHRRGSGPLTRAKQVRAEEMHDWGGVIYISDRGALRQAGRYLIVPGSEEM